MDKEQAARRYFSDLLEELHLDDGEWVSSSDIEDTYIAGWDQGQKQLLSEAVMSFREHWEEERWDRYFDKHSPQYQQSKKAWQAAKLSCAAELAAKDAEIDRLNFLLSHFAEKEGVTHKLSAELAAKDEEIEKLKQMLSDEYALVDQIRADRDRIDLESKALRQKLFFKLQKPDLHRKE